MKKKIDKIPAILDFIQSASGLLLALFIMGHLLFEASIVISKEAMHKVTLMFEGYYIFGSSHPVIITVLAFLVFVLFIIHAGVAMRKFPANYKQYKTMKTHIVRFNHEDTSLWMIQATTGFVMFFAGSIHLYMMMANPSDIGPYLSSNRVLNENMWPLYIVLLVSVVLHAFIGMYRLALKWGFMEGSDIKVSRLRFKTLMRGFIAVYLVVGFVSLATYIRIALNEDVSQKYQKTTIHVE